MKANFLLPLLLQASCKVTYSQDICEDLVKEHCNKYGAVTSQSLKYAIREIVREEIRLALEEEGNSWIIFQRRIDGSVNFNRGWSDYVNGFGNESGEFWLGLAALHDLTSDGRFELGIDMRDNVGRGWYAVYSDFKVGPASDDYRLTAMNYSGTATDSLGNGAMEGRSHTGRRFSTHDSDHDGWWYGNCASRYKGGWWYNDCYDSNLNGIYNNPTNQGIVWVYQTTRTNMFMTFVQMKFRRVD